MLIGGTRPTASRKGFLVLIGAKHGIDWQIIARENNVEPGEILKVGRTLKISVRRIVPKSIADGILVNILTGPSITSRKGSLPMRLP